MGLVWGLHGDRLRFRTGCFLNEDIMPGCVAGVWILEDAKEIMVGETGKRSVVWW